MSGMVPGWCNFVSSMTRCCILINYFAFCIIYTTYPF
uniref:Uncharacterized protein n=1 Tax=Rhizophora mucronata TaxID=61149 RepID=A0A2P2NBE9_RHIMU